MPISIFDLGGCCCDDGGPFENIGCTPCDLPAGEDLTLSWNVPSFGASGSAPFVYDPGTSSWNTGCIASNATNGDVNFRGFMDCSTGGIHVKFEFLTDDPSDDPCGTPDFAFEFQAAAGNIAIISFTCGRGSFTEVWSAGGSTTFTISP